MNGHLDQDSAAVVEKALTAATRPDAEGETPHPDPTAGRRPRRDRPRTTSRPSRTPTPTGAENASPSPPTSSCSTGPGSEALGVRTAADLDAFFAARPNLGELDRGLFMDAFDGNGGVATTLDGNPVTDALVAAVASRRGARTAPHRREPDPRTSGAAARTFTDAQRRALLTLWGGCACCGAPPETLRDPPHRPLGTGRAHRHRQRRPQVQTLPPRTPPPQMARPPRTRRHLRRAAPRRHPTPPPPRQPRQPTPHAPRRHHRRTRPTGPVRQQYVVLFWRTWFSWSCCCSSSARCRLMCRNGIRLVDVVLVAVALGLAPARAWYSGCSSITSSASASMPTSGIARAVLAPGVEEHLAHLIARRIEHRPWSSAEFAQVADQALRAAGLARDADVAPVQDQPVVRVLQELRRRELQQLVLDLQRRPCRARCRCGSRRGRCACRPRWWAGRTRCSAPRSRSCGRRPGSASSASRLLRHLAAVLVQQDLRQRDHVLRLGAVQADALDVLLEAVRRRASTIFCGVSPGKSLRVARFTDLSVACAESTTATSSSNGVPYSSSVVGFGFACWQALEDLAALLRIHRALARERGGEDALALLRAGRPASQRRSSAVSCRRRARPAARLRASAPARRAAPPCRCSRPGRAGRHSAQPMHQGSTTVCISPCAPTMASTGQASMQRVQPMQRASSMSAAFSRFMGQRALVALHRRIRGPGAARGRRGPSRAAPARRRRRTSRARRRRS